LDGDRPARSEADFDADADHAAPAGFGGSVEHDAAEQAVVLVAGDGSATLDVAEHVVPGVADLTGEEADRVDLGLVDNRRERCGRACIRALQVGPVALGFKAEHPVAGLPAIADLATDEAAGRIVATFRHGRDRSRAGDVVQVPALVARTAAAVHADVEAT